MEEEEETVIFVKFACHPVTMVQKRGSLVQRLLNRIKAILTIESHSSGQR